MKSERWHYAMAFLKAAVAYYKSLGITILRVMTDNGSCYRSRVFARACRHLKLKHIRTKPYTPRTNGNGRASSAPTNSPFFMHRYNWHRPHASIGRVPPITRLGLTEDNLLRLHT
jgi:transposase InsO family protein